MKLAVWVVLALLTAPALADATGRVVGPDGGPVPGAEVCEFHEGVATRCVKVDASGSYRLERPVRKTLLARASGYVAQKIEATELTTPVVMPRAAVLSVTVVDAATGKPLSAGKIMLDLPSGRRVGDSVPFNKAGVRIRTLEPGVVFVRAVAEGYDPGGPLPIELVGGAERSVKVPMTKSATPHAP